MNHWDFKNELFFELFKPLNKLVHSFRRSSLRRLFRGKLLLFICCVTIWHYKIFCCVHFWTYISTPSLIDCTSVVLNFRFLIPLGMRSFSRLVFSSSYVWHRRSSARCLPSYECRCWSSSLCLFTYLNYVSSTILSSNFQRNWGHPQNASSAFCASLTLLLLARSCRLSPHALAPLIHGTCTLRKACTKCFSLYFYYDLYFRNFQPA